MMRRTLFLCATLVVAQCASAESGELHGSWTAKIEREHPGKLYLSLEAGKNHQHGSTFDRSAFTNLSQRQIESEIQVPVAFELQREPGTLRFEGTFHNGRGEGDFSFTSSADYQRRLRSLGIRWESKRQDDDRDLMSLALFDVSIDFIRSMQALGYDETLDKYVAFRIFEIDPDYVRDMASVGFDHLSADKLTETRIHGATPEYIRQMRASGEDLSLNQYIESRIFQVTPEFAQAMEREGYPDLDRGLLVQFRIHGVTPQFVQELRQVGYSRVPAEKLVEMRIHGVTPAFIRRVKKAGYSHVPIDKLVEMRIFNVDPETVQASDAADR